MKYLMVDAGYTFDDSTKVIKRQYSERQSINSVYMVKEDCTVLFGDQAEPANAGDIVITFYESNFPKRMIVVKSEDWKNNLDTYNEIEQKAKEKWAKEKACIDGCEACDVCETCSPTCDAA